MGPGGVCGKKRQMTSKGLWSLLDHEPLIETRDPKGVPFGIEIWLLRTDGLFNDTRSC